MTEIDRSGCDATRHGTMGAYNHSKCRCPDAVAEWNRYHCARRRGLRKRTSAVGSSRRIQALRADGYELRDLAIECDLSWQTLQGIGCLRRPTVLVRVARAIEEMYERLCSTPGPSDLARRRAARLGYLPSAAWDDIDDPDEVPTCGEKVDMLPDQVVVARLLAGERVNAKAVDRIEAVRLLVEAGAGTGTVANRLRMSTTRVREILGILGLSEQDREHTEAELREVA